MNKIISFSLWGSDPKYCIGAIKNAKIASEIYNDWTCRYYISNTVPKHISKELESLSNTEILYKDIEGDWRSMFWRFEASYDKNVDIAIFRDTDSRLSMREKYAVDAWILSDKTFHIMRDHPYHKYPILGGMWGYKNNNKYPMKILLESFNKTNNYGTDYTFFTEILYPIVGEDSIVHDEFFDKSPFPTKRKNREFVGDVFDENDVRHPEYQMYIK